MKLRHLKRLNAEIALIQESHLTASDFHRIHKRFSCDIISSESDTQGRYVSVHLRFQNKELIVSSIYAPYSPDQGFFTDISTRLLSHPQTPHIVGGDFNSTMDRLLDKSNSNLVNCCPKLLSQSLLTSAIDSLSLTDVWRNFHPADREFTFYSNPHNMFSRIDYIFCTNSLLPKISQATIHEIVISDHAPVLITLDFLDKPGSKCLEVSFLPT